MRGKVTLQQAVNADDRITPAYAGKSSGSRCQPLSNRDHPRLCGEKVLSTQKAAYLTGSPPPMRGKVALFERTPHELGITPAYAGKSFSGGRRDRR